MSDVQESEMIQLKKGQVLYSEGEIASYVYLIETGSVMLIKENKGRLISLSNLKEKEFVGLSSFFSGKERKESAVVTSDTTLYLIRCADLQTAMKTCPEWVGKLFSTMGERLDSTMDVLRAHQISDDISGTSLEFLPEEEVKYKKSILEYRGKKGL